MKSEVNIICGDWIEVMESMETKVQCVVTSPPYFGLRDYEKGDQIGLEKTPEEYVENIVTGFRAVWDVLREDGTVWLNLGDKFATGGMNPEDAGGFTGERARDSDRKTPQKTVDRDIPPGFKEKDLMGIPWRVALALQEDGWWIRNDIIWHKPNPMPRSVTDRCTESHEHIFLLTKSKDYYFDHEAIKEPAIREHFDRYEYEIFGGEKEQSGCGRPSGDTNRAEEKDVRKKRNKRDVWSMGVANFRGQHHAVFPAKLPNLCVKAGSDEGDVVLDPLMGSGTTGMVASRMGRDFVGIDVNKEYCRMAEERIDVGSLFDDQQIKLNLNGDVHV